LPLLLLDNANKKVGDDVTRLLQKNVYNYAR